MWEEFASIYRLWGIAKSEGEKPKRYPQTPQEKVSHYSQAKGAGMQ